MNTATPNLVKKTALATALAAGVCLSCAANAAFVVTLDENDCAGVFSNPTGFNTCTIPEEYDANQSPVIAKFNTNGNGGSWEFNSALFPNVTADDFTIFNNGDGTGTWTYTPDLNGVGDADNDPLVTFYVAKGGNSFNLFSNGVGALPNQTGPYPNTNTWSTPINPANGKNFGLSHITFYDHGNDGGGPPVQIPEPGSILLIGAALAGMGFVRRRKVA